MARPLRIEYPGAWHHVMNRGGNRRAIFRDQEDRRKFYALLGESASLWHIRIHAYSLMPNHYHLLLETPEANLSRAMRHVDGVYTQRFNRRHGRDGSLFRGRFKSILIERESYLLELVRYIHLNGVKAGRYTSPQDDPHTSHAAYLGLKPSPPWLTRETVLAQLSSSQSQKQARRRLAEFVQAGTTPELNQILEDGRWPALLGSKPFIQELQEKLPDEDEDEAYQEVPQLKQLRRKSYPPEEILRRVAEKFGITLEQVIRRSQGRPNEARKVAIYLLRAECGLTFREIGQQLGGVGRGSVAAVCSEAPQMKRRWEKFRKEILEKNVQCET